MRKRSCYRPRPKSPPMLVNRGLIDGELELRERMIAEAFAGGWATTEHFDNLVDMRNVLTLAATHKDDRSTLAMCAAMKIVIASLRDRYNKTRRMGATGEELKLLRVFVDTYRDFWMRQPVALYELACDELTRVHELKLYGEAA